MDEQAASIVSKLEMPPMNKLVRTADLIQNDYLIYINGGLHVNNIIGSFNNSKLSGNVGIQSRNVAQTQNIGNNDELRNAFKGLEELIKKIEDETTKDQAEMNSEILKEAIQSEDKPKCEKVLKFLVGALGVVQPIITIAQLAGIPVPNIPNP